MLGWLYRGLFSWTSINPYTWLCCYLSLIFFQSFFFDLIHLQLSHFRKSQHKSCSNISFRYYWKSNCLSQIANSKSPSPLSLRWRWRSLNKSYVLHLTSFKLRWRCRWTLRIRIWKHKYWRWQTSSSSIS